MTQEKIPLVAVLGSPVAHSKSPLLHGFWLKQFGISGHYIPIDVKATDLEQVLQTLPKMGFVGANVTLPHKEKILSIADQISDRAALIGAANTLVFQPDGKLYADNTDGYGFIENDDGGKDVFLHVSALEAAGIDTLEEGMPVEFEIGENRGKENAINIKKK